MTQRKPDDISWESWVDRLIREAHERGEFDRLPGRGRPLPGIDGRHDELWWLKEKLRRENVSVVPPTLEVRRDIEEARERIAGARSEAEVRRILAAINARIRHLNAHATAGPPSNVVPLNVDREVARWLRCTRRSEEDAVTRKLRCADLTGDCDAVVTGENDEEILEQAIPHAEQAHGLEDSEELRGQLRGAIGDA